MPRNTKKQFRWSANEEGNELRDGAWRDGKNTQIVARRAEGRAMHEENAIENAVWVHVIVYELDAGNAREMKQNKYKLPILSKAFANN